MSIDGIQEAFPDACQRRSRELSALSEHTRSIADWLDSRPGVADDMKLRMLRDDLRRTAHDLDDAGQGLRDLARRVDRY